MLFFALFSMSDVDGLRMCTTALSYFSLVCIVQSFLGRAFAQYTTPRDR